MTYLDHPAFLRTVLGIDAATCVATGLLMTAGAGTLAAMTLIPSGVLVSAGASLFPVAAFIAFVAMRQPMWWPGLWLIILGNAAWVAGSAVLLLGGGISPNALGTAFIVVQATAVALLAMLEYLGLGRSAGMAR